MILELLPKEKAVLFDNQNEIRAMGFDFDDFGENSIVLRQVPVEYSTDPPDVLIKDIIDRIEERGGLDEVTADEFLYTVACKAAIKANRKLNEQEIKALISDFAALRTAYTCPHGRPVLMQINKRNIEKEFKRIL